MAEVAKKSRKANPNRGSKPGERRGGRKAGTPNILNAQVKDMIVNALHRAGGEDYLYQQALEQPKAFMTLIGRVLPLQVTGEGGGPVQIEKIVREVVDPNA